MVLACACLVFITASPLVAARLEKEKPVNTGQVQVINSAVESKGMTQAPNRVSTGDKVSSTGHKHDGQGSEDLRPNPLEAEAAESVDIVRPIPGNKPMQQ